MSAPLLVMLAGPNGAGKSTFYESHLRGLELPFLNADILAREIGVDAYTAAEAIAAIREELVRRRKGFITETVLSDPVGAKVEFLAKAAKQGFDVTLIFIGIEDSEMSRRRVASRVAAGGHDVPVEKLRARFARTLENLDRAISRLPRVMVYDNSSFDHPHRLVAEFRNGAVFRRALDPPPAWARRFLE